jgi:hypothetical protein
MLVGLIWVIQVVTYPQFYRVGIATFREYHLAHCWRIGLLISPLLVVEFASAAWLLRLGERQPAFLVSAGLMVVNWLSTTFLQAPSHVELMEGFNAPVIRRLIRTNWLRTVNWTVRGILVGYVAARLIP